MAWGRRIPGAERMTTQVQPSTMRRKAGAGRPPPEIGRPTVAKALRTAVVQAANEIADLPAAAGMVDESQTALTPFVEALPDPALLALVEGPGARFGLLVLDNQAVAALIEIQTTGRVVARPADPRAPTRTDAIMCADFIDRFLEVLEQRAAEAELEVAPAISGFRYGLALAEPRAIVMTLEDIPYRNFRFEVDFGHGAKTGAIQLLLPYDPPGVHRAGAGEAEAFSEAMRAQVLETQAVLIATLLKRKMTLAEVAGLEVGSRLVLPRAALANIAVEALDGTVVAQGRLGQVNGHRAIRLTAAETGGLSAPDMAAVPTPAPRPKALDMDLGSGGASHSARQETAEQPPDPAGFAGTNRGGQAGLEGSADATAPAGSGGPGGPGGPGG